MQTLHRQTESKLEMYLKCQPDKANVNAYKHKQHLSNIFIRQSENKILRCRITVESWKHDQQHRQALLKAKYCPWVAASSCTQKTQRKPYDLDLRVDL